MRQTRFETGFHAGRAVRWGLLAAALAVVETAGPGDSYGYHYLFGDWSPGDDKEGFIYRVGSRFQPRPSYWDPDQWGPGETLSINLEDSPDWGLPMAEVRRALELALNDWSSIATADIRWEVGRVATSEALDLDDLWLEGVYILVAPPNVSPGTAPGTAQISGGHDYGPDDDFPLHKIDRCIVTILPAEFQQMRWTMTHELGHCLGLAHPETTYIPSQRLPDPVPAWRNRSVMMGSWDELVTEDDRIGASLLRPRPGFLERTGGIWGNVLVHGEGQPRVNVLATRVGRNGAMEASVNRFTDERGEFVIEGLDPGDYALLAVPLMDIGLFDLGFGFDPYFVPDPYAHLRPAFRLGLVRVRAGTVAGPFTLTMQPDENWWRSSPR